MASGPWSDLNCWILRRISIAQKLLRLTVWIPVLERVTGDLRLWEQMVLDPLQMQVERLDSALYCMVIARVSLVDELKDLRHWRPWEHYL